MLIESHRHTTKDLEFWRELEYADHARGLSKTVAKRAATSLSHIAKFCRQPCYVGVSWGKDSVVVADLVVRAARVYQFDLPIFAWIRVEPIANPDCESVRDAFLALHDIDYREIVVQCHRDEQGVHATGTLERGCKMLAEAVGTNRRITGVRAEESSTRTISAKVHGVATEVSCRPIIAWSAPDIFGWLAIKELPVHPVYGMTGGGRWQREHLRVASLDGKRGRGWGREIWEREYYGDILRRLEAEGRT